MPMAFTVFRRRLRGLICVVLSISRWVGGRVQSLGMRQLRNIFVCAVVGGNEFVHASM